MGSVQGGYRCKRCGGEGFYDFNYNTGENYESCLCCGRTFIDDMKRTNGEVVFDQNDSPVWNHKVLYGYGIVSESYVDDPVSGRTYPLTTARWSKIRKIIKEWKRFASMNPESGFDITKSHIYRYDAKRRKIQVVFGGKCARENLKKSMEYAKEYAKENGGDTF